MALVVAAVADAGRELQVLVQETEPGLVEEIAEFIRPTPRIEMLEEALCRICCAPPQASWHAAAANYFYKGDDQKQMNEAFLQGLARVNTDKNPAGIAEILEPFVKNPDLSPEGLASSSMLFVKVAAWVRAVHGHASALAAPSAAAVATARASFDDARRSLQECLENDPTLVEEIAEMMTPPPKVEMVEEALCKICSVPPGDSWHAAATNSLYRAAEEGSQNEALQALMKANVAGNPSGVLAILDPVVGNPDLSPDEFAKSSLLFGKVAAYLHAMHGYCKVLAAPNVAQVTPAKAALDDAGRGLQETIEQNKELVEEMAEMCTPPPRIAKMEEALCKLCARPEATRADLYKGEDQGAKNEAFLGALHSVNAAGNPTAVAAILAPLVLDSDLSPDEVGKSSMLFGKVSVWVHALHGYCRVLVSNPEIV